jgi:predicted RND superfamily exporter protein
VTGVPVQKVDVARAIQHDQQVLMPLAVAILAVLLALIFRKATGVLLPLAVMGISLVWTLGCYSLAGLPLNTVTALLPPVVMVLAVASSVHLYHGWLELAGESGDPRTLLAHRTAELFTPCLFTALTTMIGLLSLLTCDIPAVQQFGLFAGLGVMVAFVVAITLVPAVLSYLPLPGQRQRHRNRPLLRIIRRLMQLVFRQPGRVFWGAVLLCGLALPVLDRIDNNTDLVRFFHEDSPIFRDTMALDQEIGGVVPLEFMIARRDGGPLLTADLFRRLAAWREQIQGYPEVTGTLSLLDLLEPLNRAERGDPSAPLPGDDAALLELIDLLLALPEQDLVGRLLSTDLAHLRLSVQMHALGTAATSRISERLQQEGSRRLGEDFVVTATGSYLQISNDSNRLVGNLLKSFLLSLVTIMITLFLLFRNMRLLLAALVPNLIPLAWTAALMGWFDIDLSTGTAMVAAVAIGLVVDNTIHFLHRYRLERHGHTRPALLRAALGTGQAMIISTIVLTLGFWVGAFSSFLPSVYFSLMTGVTLIGALLCDLLVLPAGLLLLDRMRPTRALLVLVLVPVLAGAAIWAPPARAELGPPVPLVSERQDLPARWTAIPRDPPQVGTLRLVKRGTAVVLQTDLETTVLRRVLGAIQKREQERWQPESPERPDMERYLAQLKAAVALVEQRVAARPASQDRRRRLQIEFIADPPHHRIVLLTREPDGPWEAFSPLPVSAKYLYGDMLTILVDNLAETHDEALAILRPLLPPGTPLPENGK